MKQRFLEAGQIVNTHGIRGEVKIVPWCDSPEFLCGFDTLYIDEAPIRLRAARPHKGNVLAALEGVDTVEGAMALKGKTVHIDRADVTLPEGRHFLADLIGLRVVDADNGAAKLAKLIIEECTQLNLFVGKAMNVAHKNSNLPFDLSVRMNLVEQLKECVEHLGKAVNIKYY